MPITACTPVPLTAALIAPDRSPSLMSLMRAPAWRTCSIRSAWRGRSRMTTVMSRDERPSASAMMAMFALGGRVMSTLPAATGPTQSFSRYVSGACSRPPFSEAARTVIALPWPPATRFVPSSGSTAMSISGWPGTRAPTSSPMYSIGASSRSPSPMTIRPHIGISSIAWRMASVAAWSAPVVSPRPIRRAESIAAASVTRIISRARISSMGRFSPVTQRCGACRRGLRTRGRDLVSGGSGAAP